MLVFYLGGHLYQYITRFGCGMEEMKSCKEILEMGLQWEGTCYTAQQHIGLQLAKTLSMQRSPYSWWHEILGEGGGIYMI